MAGSQGRAAFRYRRPDSPGPTKIFSPPYLFRPIPGQPGQSELAPRPEIGYAPTEVVYDTQFGATIAQPLPYIISKVSLIRLGAVTHGFDMDQRFVLLEFFQNGFHVQVTAPEDGSIAAIFQVRHPIPCLEVSAVRRNY